MVGEQTTEIEHTCHHPRCNRFVPEKMFACRDHWYSLPKYLRDGIWAAYVPGQEIDKTPSDEYLAVTGRAIAYWNRVHSA